MNRAIRATDRLTEVAEALSRGLGRVTRSPERHPCADPPPSRNAIVELYRDLRRLLLPGDPEIAGTTAHGRAGQVGATLERVSRGLAEATRRAFCFTCTPDQRHEECVARSGSITARLIERLPELQHWLAGDVRAAYEGDPACRSPDEAVLCYPGIEAVTCYRIAHLLDELGVPLAPRILTEYAHSVTGIDIHPGATIGERFFIDHGTGVVVGETAVIGNSVRLYQGVTLGAKSFPLDAQGRPIKGIERHPIIEDEVVIYSGATILGRVTIGKGSVIGGNVWLTRSVPPGSRVVQARVSEEVYEAGSGI